VKTKPVGSPKNTHTENLHRPKLSPQSSEGRALSSSLLHTNAKTPGNHVPKLGEDRGNPSSPFFTTTPSGCFVLTLGSGRYQFRLWEPILGRVITGRFALDTETTLIDENRPAHIPILVLGMAFDGRQGWFILAEDIPTFLAAHPANPLILHNAAFDLAVLQATHDRLGLEFDAFARVETGKVADTLILARLLSLGTVGHSARNQCSLDYCARHYLSLSLPKDDKTPDGELVRETFGRYLGRPLEAFPAQYLQYAAADPVATWLLFERLKPELAVIKAIAPGAYGYAGERWLDEQWKKHGPGTHDIQLRASIVLDKISRTGVLIDHNRREEKVAILEQIVADTHRTLALAGLPTEGKGSPGALRKRIEKLAREHKRTGEILPLIYTETGQISTGEEQLKDLAGVDPVLDILLQHRQAAKLLSTYAKKMHAGKRVHGKFQFLMNTGRTSCGGGFNLQNLPKEKASNKQKPPADHEGEAEKKASEGRAEKKPENTIRGCFVPAPGNVFVVVDYKTIELVTLGWAWKHQLGFGGSLHEIVSEGHDMHQLIAAHVLGKAPEDVTKDERDAAKPVSLGRPGGLSWRTIQKQAKNDYGVELSEEQVHKRMQAYETLCPELTDHLAERVNAGLEIARALGLTPATYNTAIGKARLYLNPDDEQPVGWLGLMLLKVLESPAPMTKPLADTGNQPRVYSPMEIDFFWTAAARLPTDELDDRARDDLRERKPSKQLRDAISRIYSREPVITATGRLRANASYCACRNGIMQGLAADGAIYALWKLSRAGCTIVNFIHDEVIIEVPEDENLPAKITDIERLMITGMQTVVPGANVRVETEVRRSFSKADVVSVEESRPEGIRESATDG
jgi:DNA polymerase I-like protein with 3'-5' exonuclease and polymerase domains